MSRWGFSRIVGLRSRLVVLTASVTALVTAGLAVILVASASAAPHLAFVQRAAAAPAGATALGAPSASAAQTGIVVLKPRDPAAIQAFLTNLDAKGSSSYHHYLPAGQFAGQFGPTQATIDAVKSQLTGDSLTVSSVSSNGMLIHFTGTTSAVDSAFGTTLERYQTASGAMGEQTTSAVELPSTVSSDVTAVIGLNTVGDALTNDAVRATEAEAQQHPAPKTSAVPSTNGNGPTPCAAAQTAAQHYNGLSDDQIADAYGADPLYAAGDTGAGEHIALYELEPFDKSDLDTFDSCYFPNTASTMESNVHQFGVDGGAGTGAGSGEAILDVEDLSAMAPGASIDVYTAPNSSEGALDAYNQIIDTDQDNIISSSWTYCEQDEELADPGYQQAEYYLFEQAAAQGQTLLDAAGDTGTDSCNEIRSNPVPTDQNPLSVNDPASQPYVMGVGGTTIQDATPGADFDETVWNDGANFGGGGGGLSADWAAPSWQLENQYFPRPGDSTYANADSFEANSAKDGVSASGEPWTTSSTYFCATNTSAGYSTSTPCRGVPDVSAQADQFTGAVTVYNSSFGGWMTTGGTSSATPIWAGLLALVDASATCQSNGLGPAASTASRPTGTGVGFVPPLLYSIAANASEYASDFHDITSGNNDIYGFDNGESYPAGPGYDLASGLGSPILENAAGTAGLAIDLCDDAATTSSLPSITGLTNSAGTSSTSGPVAGGMTLVIQGDNFEPSGVTVSSVTVGGDTITPSAATDTSVTITLPAGTKSLAPGNTTNTDPTTGNQYGSAGSVGTQDGAGPAEISVALSNGQTSRFNANTVYNYVDQDSSGGTLPQVTGMEPYAGVETEPSGTTRGPVTIYGSGFAAGDTVTFGGVAGTSVTVISPTELTVTPPDYSSASTDCETAAAITKELAAEQVTENDPAADDVCQTEVVVTNANGSSSTEASGLPTAYEGPAVATQDGLSEAPIGTEVAPQPDEFDYYPSPEITQVSTDTSDPSTLADADPAKSGDDSLVTLTGQGLNSLTINEILVGDPTLNDSVDDDLAYISGTQIELAAPADATIAGATPRSSAATSPDAVPVAVESVGSDTPTAPSTAANVTYAGIPAVTGVTTGTGTDPNLPGIAVTPIAGGDSLTLDGAGLQNTSGPLGFVDTDVYGFGDASQYTYTPSADGSSLTTKTPADQAAIDDVEACSESGCSTPSSASSSTADEILFYPPGNPSISSISTSSGPAAGGTEVTITGQNLSCLTGVSFGTTPALSSANQASLLDCGSPTTVVVTAPAGTLGSTVPISLTTVESDVSNASAAMSPTDFTYTANPSASPSSEGFGSVDIGSSKAQTLTITNPTSGAISFGTAALSGSDPGQFSISSDNCSGTTLGASDSCTIGVSFTPTSSGGESASVGLPYNGGAATVSVPLSGTGVVPVAPGQTTTVTTPGPTTTVVSPGPTVTTPGPTTTVIEPGTTTVIEEPGTTVTKTYDCETVTTYTYKTVTKKVKVNGKYKLEKVKEKVPEHKQECTLVSTKTTAAQRRAAARRAAEKRAAEQRAAAARARSAAARK